MELLVRDYLLTHSFDDLELEHGVCARPSADFSKFSLNYDMILAKPGDKVADQCRGVVIRPVKTLTASDWNSTIVGHIDVLAWPMNRFYNHGDPNATVIDWSSSDITVMTKLDGTMIVVYWDNFKGKWCAGTRAVCEADLPVRKEDITIGDATFADLFWEALTLTLYSNSGPIYRTKNLTALSDKFRDKLDKYTTYVFELTGPHNRVVVKYDQPRVTLLAARKTQSGVEVNIDDIDLGVDKPAVHKFNDIESINNFVQAGDPASFEGVVVRDSHFNRLKVKNIAWVLSSRAKDLVTVSRRNALEAIIQHKIDDVIPLVEKDIGDQLIAMQDGLREYFLQIEKNFAVWKAETGTNRKLFAEKVILSHDWASPYFAMWEGKATTVSTWAQKASEAGRVSSSTLDAILKRLDKLKV